MNKKIFAVFALLIVVASIGAASAFDWGDLFGGSKNETVTIKGIDFNIPEGFKESSSTASSAIEGIKDSGALDDLGDDFDLKVYSKDNTEVGLFVYNYSSLDTDDVLSNFANETTINDVGGYMEVAEGYYIFVYGKDKCVIMIASNDKNVIGDFLKA